jgi:hypothetical protein
VILKKLINTVQILSRSAFAARHEGALQIVEASAPMPDTDESKTSGSERSHLTLISPEANAPHSEPEMLSAVIASPPPIEASLFETPTATVPQIPVAAVMTLDELKEIFAGSDWSKLMRNARDGGATSILACRILEKTMLMLEQGYKQVELMTAAAQDVRATSDQLSSVSEDMKLVSNQTRIVSINASIEARRAGEHGRAFNVVAQEMTTLSDDARNLTHSIDTKLDGVNEKIALSHELCAKVGRLFTNMNRELEEFRRLMTRVEQLSGIQVEQLATIEKTLTTVD